MLSPQHNASKRSELMLTFSVMSQAQILRRKDSRAESMAAPQAGRVVPSGAACSSLPLTAKNPEVDEINIWSLLGASVALSPRLFHLSLFHCQASHFRDSFLLRC